jgi:uronate dehydrogenase
VTGRNALSIKKNRKTKINMKTLLITGAAGTLGTILRDKLKGYADELRLSDIADMGDAGDGEEVVPCDLSDFGAVMKLVDGVGGIIHLGGMSVENTFETILNANIRGTYNIFEAARQCGKPRVLFASSNHTIGFHPREERLDANSPLRPDSLYGVSKCFGESLARYYFDKFSIESASVRIGSCFEEPRDRRMLATWLSPDDFVSMIKAIFEVPRLGSAMLYGASANKEQWWNNDHAAYVGWSPTDSAEQFRAKIEAATPVPDWDDPAVKYQGGGFAAAPHFEDK